MKEAIRKHSMKRFVASALILSSLGLFSMVGCGETSKTEEKTIQQTPTGTTTETKEEKINQSGSNPPPPTGAAETPK
jgi:hypothetical protein